jgi:monothiol glutaredoxin
MDTIKVIEDQIKKNKILLYMKGTPKFPQCGFSAQTVEALVQCNAKFSYVNILDNPDIRLKLPIYADWPTFPQLWIQGELIGGCDIVSELLKNNELQDLINAVSTPILRDQ